MTQHIDETPTAASRHWLYGANLAVLVIVGVVIIGFLLYITTAAHHRFDWTSSGMYSLSDSTKKMLAELDQKGQNYEIVSYFSSAGADNAAEHQQRVDDLINDYARQSKHITVDDPHEMLQDTLDQKIRDRFTAELKPYQKVVDDFPKVRDDLNKFLTSEAASLNAFAQKSANDPAAADVATQLNGFFGDRAPEVIKGIDKVRKDETESVSPDLGKVVDAIKTPTDTDESLADVQKTIANLADPATLAKSLPADQKFPPAILDYLTKNADRYKAAAAELKGYLDEIDKLAPLKVNGVIRSVRNNSIVVLGPTDAKVIDEFDVFKQDPTDPNDPNSAMGPETFEGEQAISSALLGMSHPDKVKVVFVTATPSGITAPGDPLNWSHVADALKEQNFDVLEWAPTPAPAGPQEQPQTALPPPASGKGVIWIVLPPNPPTQQQMMSGQIPDPKVEADALKAHMDAGGSALLLASASGGGPMGMLGGGDTYAFDAIAKSFGIVVQPKYTVVQSTVDQDQGNVAVPQFTITRFEDHQITRPLQSFPTDFQGVPSQASGDFIDCPTVVSVDKTLPAGIQAAVLVYSPNDADHWGESNFSRATITTAKYDKDSDYAAPCPLAVASEKNAGDKDKEQRLIVIGTPLIGADGVLNQRDTALVGNRLVALARYPGNGELLTNSVLWLAGYENMISVSSKSSAALRIREIKPITYTILRWMLFLGFPVIALVVGGVVFAIRRR